MNHSKRIFKIRDLVIKTLAATPLVITNPCLWLAEQRKLFPRADEPWNDREDLFLVQLALALCEIDHEEDALYLSQSAVSLMSGAFSRSPRAIRMRVARVLQDRFLFPEGGGPRNA